jgi:hypothetical protein
MLHGLHAKLHKGMKMLLVGAVNAKWKVYCLKSFESIPKNTSKAFKKYITNVYFQLYILY